MISFIVWSIYLYLVQLMLPNFIKSRIEYSERASKALRNLGESFPIFLSLAILSIVLSSGLQGLHPAHRRLLQEVQSMYY